MLSILSRRHSAPVIPCSIDTQIFTDIRPHPSPPEVRGWKPMKVFPLLKVESNSPVKTRRNMNHIFSIFVYKTIKNGDLETLRGMLCNPITEIIPTKEMATQAVLHGHLKIVIFLHQTFGLFPTEKAYEYALISQDKMTINFLRAWSGRDYRPSFRVFSS